MPKSKKSLDKDIMFSKIMPSSMKREEAAEELEKSEIPEKTGVPEKLEEPVILPPVLEDDNRIETLRSKLFSRTEEWKSGSGASTFNIMEDMVLSHLDEAISKFNCCRCDRCRRDVAALALNKLPAKYAVAEPENVSLLTEQIVQKEVFDALVKAIIQVRAHPRH